MIFRSKILTENHNFDTLKKPFNTIKGRIKPTKKHAIQISNENYVSMKSCLENKLSKVYTKMKLSKKL